MWRVHVLDLTLHGGSYEVKLSSVVGSDRFVIAQTEDNLVTVHDFKIMGALIKQDITGEGN